MEAETIVVIFAMMAALGLLGAVGINIILTVQQASAEPPPTQGCRNSIAFNASHGRCFHG